MQFSLVQFEHVMLRPGHLLRLRHLMWMQWSLRADLSFPAMSQCQLLSDWCILGRSGMVQRYLSSLCLKLSVLQLVLFLMSCGMHIEEVWSTHHEASFSDCFDHTASCIRLVIVNTLGSLYICISRHCVYIRVVIVNILGWSL